MAERLIKQGRIEGHASSFLALLIAVLTCTPSLSAKSARTSSVSVILISVDTLRASHLQCYGGKRVATPNIDALTRGGTLFAQADSQVPMTLPSHTVLLTSTYPFFNKIEENGDRVPPGAVTLGGILKAHGYRTAAFIGGFVLDRRFGLNQGFDFYDSPFGVQNGGETVSLRRSAPEVTRAAASWLRQNSDRPFFVFIHIFDLHRPYVFPPGYRRLAADGYDSELGNADRVLGAFWRELDRMGIFSRALIVFTSDHGESLGDHGEDTHSYFIYESTLHVPLIIHWPEGSGSYPARVDAPAGLIDVAPTILQFLGIRAPAAFQGQSLFDLLNGTRGVAPRGVYSESVYARDHFGCSPLRSLRAGRYKYIEAPEPELYDLTRDPAETHNIYSQKKDVALEMRRRLRALMSRYAPYAQLSQPPLSPETQALLRSLGYTAVMRRPNRSGPDPKDRLGEYREYGRAVEFASAGNLSAAVKSFRIILKSDPNNALVLFDLAATCHRLRDFNDAVSYLNRALERNPSDARAQELLGTIWLEEGNYPRAERRFKQLLELAPADYGANYNLGVLAAQRGQWAEAIRYLRIAVEADPQSEGARRQLGVTYLSAGNPRQATVELQKAVRLSPRDASVHDELGIAWRDLDRPGLAAQEFRKALAANPNDEFARKALHQLS
ncbi:MAG: sulfatase-like hydrolase/transferase, partial [Terriglobia bacterium]